MRYEQIHYTYIYIMHNVCFYVIYVYIIDSNIDK